jgi:hypothetical protein
MSRLDHFTALRRHHGERDLLAAATHADAVHYDIRASGNRSTHCCGTIWSSYCSAPWPNYCGAVWPGASGADYAPGTDHGTCFGRVECHGCSEPGNGKGDEYEQAHVCLQDRICRIAGQDCLARVRIIDQRQRDIDLRCNIGRQSAASTMFLCSSPFQLPCKRRITRPEQGLRARAAGATIRRSFFLSETTDGKRHSVQNNFPRESDR